MKNLFPKWSNWIDLSAGMFEHRHYLLQGRRNSNGKVQYRIAKSGTAWYTKKMELEDLQKLK